MLNFDNNNQEAGYRLEYLQVLNWGLYSNDEVFTINPNSKSSLLIGGNASGKTTLVDALLTLFLSKPKYNLAGDSQKKHDRDIASYVFGNYSEFTNDKGEIEPEQLRTQKDYSLILAVFANKGLNQKMTMGQFFWFNHPTSKVPERLYFIAYNKSIRIENDLCLNDITGIADFKKRLELMKIFPLGTKTYPDRRGIFTDKFTLYSDKFCEIFGIRNKDKALNLFNQTVSLKNIGDLNHFIKNEMLEHHNLEDEIKKIKTAFDESKMFSDKIDEAEKKLEILKIIDNNFEKYKNLEAKNFEIQGALKVLDAFFAGLKKNLLEKENSLKINNLKEFKTEFSEKFDDENGILMSKKIEFSEIEKDIKSIENNSGINQIESDIQVKKANLYPVRNRYNECKEKLLLLDYQIPDNINQFNENRINLERLNINCNENLIQLNSQKDNFLKEIIAPIEQKIIELRTEKINLERNKNSLIDSKYENIRAKIAEYLKITKNELPYICELIKIKDSEKEWQPAIEKLLRNFGLSLLVTDNQCSKMIEWLNKINLNDIKISFYNSENIVINAQFTKSQKFVYYKLEFKPKISENITFWLQHTLSCTYNFVCCNDLPSFYKAEKAIMKNGLIKHNTILNEKDDTKLSYILGWNNAEKIELLKNELDSEIRELREKINKQKEIESEIAKQTIIQTVTAELLKINDFAEIDYFSLENQIFELKQKLDKLNDNKQLVKFREKYLELKREIDILEKRKNTLTNEMANLEAEIKSSETTINECVTDISSIPKYEQDKFSDFVLPYIESETKYSLQVSDNKYSTKRNLQKEQYKLQEPFEALQKKITDQMLVFNQQFYSEAKRLELKNEIEFIEEYISLCKQLEVDDLPKLRDEFDEKLRKRSDRVITDFKMTLERHENQVYGKIKDINLLLKKREYQEDKSFLQIIPHITKDEEIELFKSEVKSCLSPIGGEISPEQKIERNKLIFKNIKSLLEKLEKYNRPDERWANKVTDVRNWFNFTASERDVRNEDIEIKAHSGTGGKSGGETFKITYTILASAIADEFGLDTKTEAKTNTLRFIAVDEIFNNLGVTWSHYVMKMFEKMDLQLLIVSPDSLEKANIAKEHISNVHWTYKKTVNRNEREEDNSYVIDLTFNELREKYKK